MRPARLPRLSKRGCGRCLRETWDEGAPSFKLLFLTCVGVSCCETGRAGVGARSSRT